MKTLVSLDFASQESWGDMQCALRTLFSAHSWKRGAATSAVIDFLRQSVYAKVPSLHVSLFFSGRAALRLTLQSLNLPAGAVVAVQAFTCAAVVLPILSLGLTPLYVDITPHDFSMDSTDLKNKYSASVKVLILQHSFGIVPTSREEIVRFCAEHGIFLIEDLAHGFVPGLLSSPDLSDSYCALISFGRSKLLSSVFGAAIVTPNNTFANAIQSASQRLSDPPRSLIFRCLLYKILTPIIKNTYRMMVGRVLHRLCMMIDLFPPEVSQNEKRGMYDAMYESTYPEPLAQTLRCQITKLPSLLQTIRARVGEYQQMLPHSDLASTPLNRFPYVLKEKSDRSHILRHFERQNISLGTWYDQPVGPGKVSLDAVRYISGSCPVAEDIATRIVNLPLNVEKDMARFIAKELETVVSSG